VITVYVKNITEAVWIHAAYVIIQEFVLYAMVMEMESVITLVFAVRKTANAHMMMIHAPIAKDQENVIFVMEKEHVL